MIWYAFFPILERKFEREREREGERERERGEICGCGDRVNVCMGYGTC